MPRGEGCTLTCIYCVSWPHALTGVVGEWQKYGDSGSATNRTSPPVGVLGRFDARWLVRELRGNGTSLYTMSWCGLYEQ